MLRISRTSHGATAVVIASMRLIAGLEAAHASPASIIATLLTAAIAVNLTDSFSTTQ